MAARLEGKTAVVVGAGQTPGETIGNGRATAILFAREGARVLCIDRDLASAEETVQMIAGDGMGRMGRRMVTEDLLRQATRPHRLARRVAQEMHSSL